LTIKKYHIAFLIFTLGDLTGILLHALELMYLFKPLLMPCLIYYVYEISNKKINTLNRFLFLALFFSWFGDIFLMFGNQFFIAGLASFLLAHLFYIQLYRVLPSKNLVSILRSKPQYIIAFLLLGMNFIFILYPYLGELKWAVFLYMGCILVMNIYAVNRYGFVSTRSFWLVFIGAFVFMISDLCIALNKFVFQDPSVILPLIVMSTYCLAQWLIVEGIILQYKTEEY